MIAIFFNINNSDLELKNFTLSNLIESSHAIGESPFAEQKDKATKNKKCTKSTTISTSGITIVWEYRDYCKGDGTSCTPTTCI